eukprot:scaffold161576_cov24-Prasinocladus_malaysianus.AAC.1
MDGLMPVEIVAWTKELMDGWIEISLYNQNCASARHKMHIGQQTISLIVNARGQGSVYLERLAELDAKAIDCAACQLFG